MDFVLAEHAETEDRRRQIPITWIEAIMANPEQVTAGANGRKVYQSRIVTETRTCLVRLVVEDCHPRPVVVTVYRTSEIDKDWSKT